MRLRFPIFFAAVLAPLLFAGCTDKKAADNSSEPRLPARPMPVKQPDKPPMKMPPAPPPAPPKQ